MNAHREIVGSGMWALLGIAFLVLSVWLGRHFDMGRTNIMTLIYTLSMVLVLVCWVAALVGPTRVRRYIKKITE
jgi:uncharacterized membrane protein